MNTALIGTIAGLLTAIFWGTGDWLTPRSKHKLNTFQINLVVQTVGVIIFLIALAISPGHFPTSDQTLKIVGAGALINVGYLLFVKALTVGAVGIVVPLSSIYPMLALLLSIVFLNQVYTYIQVMAMVLIVLGAIFLAYEKNHQKLPLQVVYRASLLTMGAVIFWGVAFFILNPLVAKVEWQMLLSILGLVGTVVAVIFTLAVFKSDVWVASKRAFNDKTIFTASILLAAGALALYYGAGHAGNIIIPAVISATSPLISSLLGAVVDKEKLGVLKRLGATIAIAGIIILNVV